MIRRSIFSSVAACLLLASTASKAGLYTDDLSRCLVQSTSTDDKLTLVRWMFSAMSLHPSVKSMASVTPAQLDSTNKETAELFMKLLTESCQTQTRDAVKYEGGTALQASFQVLGQVAAGELFSNPDVAAGMAGLQQHMNLDKLNKVLGTNK